MHVQVQYFTLAFLQGLNAKQSTVCTTCYLPCCLTTQIRHTQNSNLSLAATPSLKSANKLNSKYSQFT